MAGILTRRCKVLNVKSFWLVFKLTDGSIWRCNVAVDVNTEMPQKELKIIAGKEAHAGLVKPSPEAAAIFTQQSRLEKLGLSI